MISHQSLVISLEEKVSGNQGSVDCRGKTAYSMKSESEESEMKWKSNPLEFVARVNAGQAPEMAIYRDGPSRSLVRQRDPCPRLGVIRPTRVPSVLIIPTDMNSAAATSGRR